jgi:hypothetical protein
MSKNKYTFKVSNITWDTDGLSAESLGLPKKIDKLDVWADSFYDADIAEALSDEYGWCVSSYQYEYIGKPSASRKLKEIETIIHRYREGYADAESAFGMISDFVS